MSFQCKNLFNTFYQNPHSRHQGVPGCQNVTLLFGKENRASPSVNAVTFYLAFNDAEFVDFAAEVVVVLLVVSCKQDFAVISSSGSWKSSEMSNEIQLLRFARPIVDSS